MRKEVPSGTSEKESAHLLHRLIYGCFEIDTRRVRWESREH
jgi:hypothetical protein